MHFHIPISRYTHFARSDYSFNIVHFSGITSRASACSSRIVCKPCCSPPPPPIHTRSSPFREFLRACKSTHDYTLSVNNLESISSEPLLPPPPLTNSQIINFQEAIISFTRAWGASHAGVSSTKSFNASTPGRLISIFLTGAQYQFSLPRNGIFVFHYVSNHSLDSTFS